MSVDEQFQLKWLKGGVRRGCVGERSCPVVDRPSSTPYVYYRLKTSFYYTFELYTVRVTALLVYYGTHLIFECSPEDGY